MEINMEKQNVMICEGIRDETLEQSIDSEIMLPDFCPDIARVLKCRAQSKIISKRVANSVLNIDGNILLTILYVDEDGDIRSFEQTLSYYRELDINTEDSVDADISSKVEYINCRALTPRKLDIHGALTIYVSLSKKCQTEFVAAAANCGVQLNCAKETVTTIVDQCEKYITINDEIEVGAGSKAISSILRSEAFITSTECKTVTGKAVVKGDLKVKVLYCTDVKLRIERLEAVIPFTQITDLENADEDCVCNVRCEVSALDLHPRTGLDGEVRTVTLSAGISISVTAMKDMELTVANDAYSVDCEIDVRRETKKLRHRIARIDESYISKHNIDLPREIAAIMDLWCDASVTNVKSDNNILMINGVLQLSMLACDADSTPLYIEKTVDYSYKYSLDAASSRIECLPKVFVNGCGYTLTGSTEAEIRVELLISADVFETPETMVISDIVVAGEKRISDPMAALTIYYAHSDEMVFDIARKYNTTVDAVRSANNIDSCKLEKDTMLLIPSI